MSENGILFYAGRSLVGSRARFLILFILLLAAATGAGAQKTLTLSGSPLSGSGDMKPQSIFIAVEAPAPAAGTPAGTGASAKPETPAKQAATAKATGTPALITDKSQFHAGTLYVRVIIKPHIEAIGDGTMSVLLDKTTVIKQVVKAGDGGITSPSIGSAFPVDIGEPSKDIREVRAIFDQGKATATGSSDKPRVIQIPVDAKRLQSLEVDYAWKNIKKTLIFKLPAPVQSGHRMRWIVLGVGAVGAVIVGIVLMRRRKPYR